jgi:protein-tyrosine phosphatase
MISFFKTRTKLKDIIPDNYIDIHSHLLPGIDDGAQTIDDSIRLVQALRGLGTSQIITTPHVITHLYDNTINIIEDTAQTTHEKLTAQAINIPFRAAAEYMMDAYFMKQLGAEPLLTLKDKYVLVEMSYINPPINLYSMLFDLQVAGYTPVLAHPERYVFYHNNFDEYQKLIHAGCLLQLNLLATVGYYGEGVAKICEKLLQKGMYSFVGSDIHHDRHVAAFEGKVFLKDLLPLHEIIHNNQLFKI